MSELFDLSPTAAGNTELFPEGMQFRNVNDGGREVQAQIARDYRDTRGVLSAGGSVNAFTITANRSFTALAQGMRFAFKSNASITGACTLNVSGGGAKEIVSADGQSLIAGDILDGQIVEVVYRSDLLKWQMVSQSAREVPDDTAMQAAAEDYIETNPDDVRNSLWVVRPIASATTTAAPSGQTDGTLYIVPTGATGSTWPSNIGKVAEALGGSWTYHTPVAGWSVYAKDTDTLYVYDTSWAAISAEVGTTSDLQIAAFKWVLSNGTDGGTPVDETWTPYVLNTTAKNTITGCSIDTGTGVVTLPAGTYLAIGHGALYENGYVRCRVQATSAGTLIDGVGYYTPPSTSTQASAPVVGGFTLASSDSVTLQYYAETIRNTYGLGRAAGKAGSGSECYASITFLSLASYQGPQGDDGDPGADGAGYLASSVTSLEVGTGSKTLTTSSGLAYTVGDFVQLYNAGGTMRGTITSYSSTSMVVSVTETSGSGTYASWTISLAGATGSTGTGYGGTSTTSLAIGTGSKTWTTQAGLAYVVGGRIRWANSSTNYMEGTITDYTTTSMTVNVTKTGGSGTLASWSAQSAGEPGADGAGSGTVTDISASGGIETDDGATVTDSGGVRGSITTNAQTGTSYTLVSGDRGKLVTLSNASAVAVTLAQAQNATRAAIGFTGWYVWVLNKGAGAVTITPTTSTIAGASNLVLSQYEGALIVSDGTNYQAIEFAAGGGTVDIYALVAALTAETAPSISDEIEVNDVSAAEARRMTLANVFKVIGGLSAETAPASDDVLPLYDTSASTTDGITIANFFKAIAQITADTSPDASDSVATYDASGSAAKSATIANVFKSLNTLTEKTAPVQNADYVLAYSAADTASRKVLLSNVGVGKYSFFVDAAAMKSTTTGAKTGATAVANRDFGLATNDSAGGSVLSFSATAKNHAWFKLAMPKGWNLGTMTARFFWTADTGTGTVEWEIAAAAVSDGDALSFTFGTAVTVTDAIGTLTKLHATAETGAITASGTPAARDLVWFEVVRDGQAGNGDDTFSTAALLIGVEITFTRSANTDD